MSETVGVKVKEIFQDDQQQPIEESVVTPEVISQEVTENLSELENDAGPVIDDTINTNLDEYPPETPVDNNEGFVRVATARLISDTGITIYRFDIDYKEFDTENGIIEFKNIVNDFNSIRPNNSKTYKDFFALFGIIRWNFAHTAMPTNTDIAVSLTKIESLINNQITLCGFKKDKFIFRIDMII